MPFPGALPASVAKQLLAFLIDAAITTVFGGGFFVVGVTQALGAARAGEPVATGPLVAAGSGVMLAFGVFQWWCQGTSGRTVGEGVVRLNTVSVATGRPAGMSHVLIRFLVIVAAAVPAGVGLLVLLASARLDPGKRNQGWHDKLAGTIVLDVRRGLDPVVALAPVSELTEWPTGWLAPARSRSAPAVERPSWLSAASAPVPPGAAEPFLSPPVRVSPTMRATAPRSATPPPPPPPPPPQSSPSPRSAPASPSPRSAPASPPPPPQPQPSQPQPSQPQPQPSQPQPSQPQPSQPQPQSPQPSPPRPPQPPPPPPPSAPQPQGSGIISSVPGMSTVAASSGLSSASDDDLDEDVEVTRLAVGGARGVASPEDPRPTVTLRLWDGRSISLTGTALVGRDPVPREDEPPPAHTLAVDDPARSVSKTHLSVGFDESGVWVRDRTSTNGTVVTMPAGHKVRCAAEQPVRVPVGASVEFGDYSFTVE